MKKALVIGVPVFIALCIAGAYWADKPKTEKSAPAPVVVEVPKVDTPKAGPPEAGPTKAGPAKPEGEKTV